MHAKGKSGLTLTAIIILLIAFVYVISSEGVVQSALRNLQGGPVYRGNPSGVALECVVRWDATTIDELLTQCEEAEVRITFFVTNEWAKENPLLISKIKSGKHEIGILGLAPNADALKKELAANAAVFKTMSISAQLFMPFDDKNAEKLRKQAIEMGYCTVLSSIDIQSKTTQISDLVERVDKNSFSGAIIRFEPTKTMLEAFPSIVAKLKEKEYPILTVGELIENKRI